MKWTRFVCGCFLLLLTLSVIASSLPEPFNFLIQSVYGVALPSDGDAWTEDNNATYPWKSDPLHIETISFSSSDKYVGSYSFNITHTSDWMRMRWYLDFGATDLSSYDALEFWIKPKWIGAEKSLFVYVEDTFNSNPRYYVKFKVTNATWSKVYLPLSAFFEGGSPTWTKSLMHFYVSDNIGASDGTQVLLDGINFRTHTNASPSNSLNRLWLPNFYSALPRFREVSNIIYDGNSYTTLLDWVNITNGASMEGNLETEALGQSIGALAYLYKEVPSPTYLAKAKLYADWLLQFQGLTGMGDGIVYYYDNATSTFDDKLSTTVNGWVLWGMSVLYDLTSNATYKTFCDNLFNTMTADAWLWNSTWSNWDQYYDNVTGWIYATASAYSMLSGASMAGLGAYYRYVEANSTAEARVNNFYSNAVDDSMNKHKMGSDTEQTMYNVWGLYESWQAFSNTTYRDEIVGMISEFYHAYSEINSNASINRYGWYSKTDSFDFLDGWGGQAGLPILMIDYETSASTFKQKAFEKYVFDYINLAKGDAWLMEYHINEAGTADKSWSTGSLFIALGLLKYFKQFVTDPYILLTDGEIKSSTYASDELTFNISGTETTMTQVYAANKGKPLFVLVNSTQQVEGTTWTYNDTLNEVTIRLNHTTSTFDVKLSWVAYSLVVDVFRNSIPTNANISLFNENMTEIETFQDVTSHEWLLPEGTYYSQAFITYNGYSYSSDLFEVNLSAFTWLAINFQFSNLTVLVTDIHNQPLENASIILIGETGIRLVSSNKSGSATIEAYYGNWTIVISWMRISVGASNIAINDAKVELTIKSKVGNVTINVTDPRGQPIKSNVTLTNAIYGLSLSGVLNGTTTTITFTQIPLVNYTLTIESEYGTQTYTVDTSQTRQIRIETTETTYLTTSWEEKTTYFLIGTLTGALITAATIFIFIKKRRKAKPPSTTHQVLLP